jgi:phosphopentomutase
MTDKEAHSGSWDGYIAALENADSLIYLLYNKIQSDSFYKDNTTLLITNDHGRHTDNFTNHGCDCDGCEHIMLLAIGKDFEENKVNDDLNYQIDICKTVGYIMKFKTPFAKGNNLIAE